MDPDSRPSLNKVMESLELIIYALDICQCCWKKNSLKNKTDALPDDVLISIISHLNLKEVARTSVLSRRWRYLWTHTTGTLDFVESIPISDTINSKQNILNPSRSRLIDWVNQVLNVHKGSTIDEFEVCFGISDESSDVINRWIKFALERRVKQLLLDFSQFESSAPYAKFALRTHVFTNCPLGSLTFLHLKNVEMTAKVSRFILSSFPLLQVLHLNSVSSLARLKIAGPSPSLRCLKIKNCLSLRRLEVHAVNFVSFTYHGPDIKKFFKEVPRLVEASVNEVFMINGIQKFSSYFSRLESLKLDLRDWRPELGWIIGTSMLPKFEKLNYLKLCWSRSSIECYIGMCTKLLDASPLLQRFVLKIYGILFNKDKDVRTPIIGSVNYQHTELKVMELRGFRGYTKDVELALRLCARLSGLETLIVDPWPVSPCDQFSVEKAVSRAQRMQNLLPTGVKLAIASHQNDFGSDSVA